MKEDMKKKIARARQYANDILAICGALEACQALEEMKASIPKSKKAPNGTFDRNKYQREYMRSYMAKKRLGKGSEPDLLSESIDAEEACRSLKGGKPKA